MYLFNVRMYLFKIELHYQQLILPIYLQWAQQLYLNQQICQQFLFLVFSPQPRLQVVQQQIQHIYQQFLFNCFSNRLTLK